MSTKLILFSLIFLTLPIHAMKRSYPFKKEYSRNNRQNISQAENTIIMPDLTGIIEDILVHHATEYPLAKKPKDATKIINTLAQTTKKFNLLINNSDINNKIIKNLAYNLYCSHETIARMLWTQQSKELLNLQLDLKKLCCSTYIFNKAGDRNTLIAQKLDDLIAQNIDLEFTYNHWRTQKTPLMLAASDDDNSMFDLLLEKGVNINNSNSHGITLLKLLTTFPILADHLFYFIKLIELPQLGINLQDRYGETALLRCLIRRRSSPNSPTFIYVIKKLLKKGADPELANKHGITPLIAAQPLRNERIISLIKRAIERKHSTS